MSKELSLVLEDGIAFQTGPDLAQLFIDGDVVPLNEDTLGKVSEWLAVAYENVTGAPYEPKQYTEGGFVPMSYAEVIAVNRGEHIIPKAAISGAAFNDHFDRLERDCE